MWKAKLQSNYKNLAEFKAYAETYGLHVRLGYNTPEEAWEANPLIQGSVKPEDFKKVKTRRIKNETHRFIVYARKERTTDSTTLTHFPNSKKEDVQIYRDRQAKIPFARFMWGMKDTPTKRNKYVTLNGFKYNLEWI